MYITVRTTAEFDSPPGVVASIIADQSVWPALVSGAERLGSFWCYQAELYALTFIRQGNHFIWKAASAADARTWLRAEVLLHDNLIGTSADISLTLAVPTGVMAIVGRPRLRRQLAAELARVVQLCAERVSATVLPQTVSAADARAFKLPALLPLASRYPRTFAAFEAMDALDHLERILRLDAAWSSMRQAFSEDGLRRSGDQLPPGAAAPSTQAASQASDLYAIAPLHGHQVLGEFDLIYAGGGLGLLHAAIMARRYGYRVLLFDRGEVGCAHREWNISRQELSALVETGMCTWDELRDVIMAEYDRGVVRFFAGQSCAPAELCMRDVLNVAIDAGALLRLARQKFAAAGGVVLDGRAFRRVTVGDAAPAQVVVELATEDGQIEYYRGRLLLDGMGSSSPLALRRFGGRPFAGVCPTVGTVVAGLCQGAAPALHDPRVGDILVSVADAQRGQQYMWEGFPGRGDELTVYLFYYDTLAAQRSRSHPRALAPGGGSRRTAPSLIELFEDYFALLPTYKQPGPQFRHLKPVYGYIPARHSLRRQEAPLLRGVLPIGDSAAQQSPLTFCGFGSHVRNLERTTALLHTALEYDLIDPRHLRFVSPFQVNVSLNWVFSRFMQPWAARDDVNALQKVFLMVLNDLGEELARRFFRDQMRWGDYHRMVLGTFRRYPRIVVIAWRVLGPSGVRRWIADYLWYSGAAAAAWLARRLGRRGRAAIGAAARVAPSLELRWQAYTAEWRVMGWI